MSETHSRRRRKGNVTVSLEPGGHTEPVRHTDAGRTWVRRERTSFTKAAMWADLGACPWTTQML